MHKLILALAVTTLTALGGASAASAWDRKTTIHTPHGTITGSAEVYCFAGACYRDGEITGVNGNTLKHSGMCVRQSYNRYACKGTVTGPEGNSRSRRVHVTVY